MTTLGILAGEDAKGELNLMETLRGVSDFALTARGGGWAPPHRRRCHTAHSPPL